jgi:hypothetical protein
MKSSFHTLVPFVSFLLNNLRLPSPELDQILDNWLKWTLLQLNSLNFWQTNSNNLLCPFITPRHGPFRKHSLCIVEKAYLFDPLPSNGRPIVAHVSSRGNVFTESLLSNGSIRPNRNYHSSHIVQAITAQNHGRGYQGTQYIHVYS